MENMIYPIKYAAMPVTNYAKGDDLILGYVVSKVYVVMELTRYLPTGIKKTCDVVFPVKGLKSSEVMADLRTPEFDIAGRCINCDHNLEVYDTFDEAKNICNIRNSEIYRSDIEHYSERTSFLQDFELKIIEKTYSIPNPEDINKSLR